MSGEGSLFERIRSAVVRDAKRLTRQEVEEHLRSDYAQGTRAEQKAHYDQHKHEHPGDSVEVGWHL